MLDVAGRARERGRTHGEALRELIRNGLELWQQHAPAAPDTERYLAAARQWTPGVVEELAGIAEGAGAAFEEIVAYNLGDELRVFDALDHCTSAGLRRGGAGVAVSGQTMDTPEWFSGLRVAIRAVETESRLTTLAFTIAGVPALCGVNSAGLAVWCNALSQLPGSRSGVPVSCLVRHLLSQPALEPARAFVERVPHASGQHYLLAAPDGIVSLECSATAVVESQAGANTAWHTNHPLTEIERLPEPDGRSSLARAAFVAESLAVAESSDDVGAVLGDRTVPVAKRHGEGGDGYTLWAVVAEHSVPPRIRVAAGPPGEAPWRSVQALAP